VVVIASVLDIPLAGAVLELLPSMLTWHLELEGAVVEKEDDEPAHAVARATRTASAAITNFRARTASCTCAMNLPNASLAFRPQPLSIYEMRARVNAAVEIAKPGLSAAFASFFLRPRGRAAHGRSVRNHRRVEFERSIGRLSIAGRHEVEQQSADDGETEPGSRASLFIQGDVSAGGHGGQRLLDQRRDEAIEWRFALRASRIALEEEAFERP
jgi:hypothetical protein